MYNSRCLVLFNLHEFISVFTLKNEILKNFMTKLGGFESCEYYEIQSWSKLCQRVRHSCLYTTGVLLEHVFIKHHCQSLTISLPPHSCCSVWRIHLERRMRLRNLSLDNLSEVARITISLRLSQDASEPTPRIHLLAIPCESITLSLKKTSSPPYCSIS